MKKMCITILLLGLVLISISGCTDSIQQGDNGIKENTPPQITEQQSDPLLDNFRGILEENDFCAIAHLGYLDGSYNEILTHIENLGVLSVFPFLEIPKENYIELEGGELYAVVPADADATVTVYSAIIDETNYTVKADRQLATFTGGVPILLKCNISEIIPNVMLEITANGKTYNYSPCISGENGQIVKTDGVYDFSPYDVLFAGIADGANPVFCDKWFTTEPNMAGDPVIMCLNILPDGTAEYSCTLVNNDYTEMFVGTWSYDIEKEMICLSLEEMQMNNYDNQSATDRKLRQINCSFTWDMDEIYFKLTHVEGDELLDGLWGGTFLFLNEYSFRNSPKG